MPKYLQLAEELRSQVETGILKPGDRLPSFNEMRKNFCATQNTVEKVFALLEKDGLIVREPSRGIFVAPASSTAKVRTGIVGVAGLGFSVESYSAYYAELLRGMQKVAGPAGVQLLLLDFRAPVGWEKVDGVIVCDWSSHILEQVPASHPCVSLLTRSPERASVIVDEALAQQEATRHLLQLGHRKIAYLHGPRTGIISLRESGYYAALAGAGIVPNPRWSRSVSGRYQKSDDFVVWGRQAMEEWLLSDWKEVGCTALLCQNDATAIGALKALRDAGIRVPEEVSVMGFDGTEISRHAAPQLTTVEVPLAAMGQSAMELLLHQIDAVGPCPEPLIFTAHVVQQGSTAPPPSP